ncbi:hypothetical protein [Curtobacterium sp. RRHDQ10]|uniref:hypothetical protein n=1 Tax=Curtobacterium phyllosphaerae TaxID=3413379 RepID=UPI003BF08F10
MPDTTPTTLTPIRSDADAVALVGTLLRRANQRQCWVLFIADDLRTIDLAMPIEDMPEHVDHDTEDHFARAMAHAYRRLGSAVVLVVWERRGGPDPSRSEWEWVHAVEVGFAAVGVPVRGQMLLHDDGVSWLESDEASTEPRTVDA